MDSDTDSVHSYPPTPSVTARANPFNSPVNPDIVVRPPSPHSRTDSVTSSGNRQSIPARLAPTQQPVPTTITQFVLAPHSYPPHAHGQAGSNKSSGGLFSRVKAALLDSAPVHSYSFSLSALPTLPLPSSPALSPLPSPGGSPVLPPAASSVHSGTPLTAPLPTAIPSTELLPLVPLLTFHDRTSTFSAGSITGILELDGGLERLLGVDTGFYIAVALTYLEFLSEREVRSLIHYTKPLLMKINVYDILELPRCAGGLNDLIDSMGGSWMDCRCIRT